MKEIMRFANKEIGLEAIVFELPNGKFRAVLRDTDAGETVSCLDHRELSFIESKAKEFVTV